MLSALWRGYVATLEIKDNELYIKDIEARIYVDGEYVWGSVLTEVFPMREELKMDWFTGSLEMPYGKVVDYGYYFSKYENYIVLDIENGVLKQEHRYTLAEYESSRYII
jgi:hypothetical protein